MDDVIKLVSETYAVNDYGVRVPAETKKQVFCKVRSVTRAEFFDGGRNGLNPQYRFDVFMGDYNDETVIEYKEKRYAVYRVYHPENVDYIELYCERKGGTNGTS